MSSENTNLNINIVETVENMMAELDTHFNDMLGDNPSTPPVMPVLTTPPPAPRRRHRAEVEGDAEVESRAEVEDEVKAEVEGDAEVEDEVKAEVESRAEVEDEAVQCAVCYTCLLYTSPSPRD